MKIKFCQNGVILKSDSDKILITKFDISKFKREKITEFSKKSASRLRDYLLDLDTSKGDILAITLTLPECESNEYWYDIIQKFRHRLSYYKIGMIWRIELQKRKIPHLHCISVIHDKLQISYIWKSWLEIQNAKIRANEFFCIYGCALQFCSLGWFRYVAAHAIKHKKSQLGWQGRQWGIFNKQFLTFEKSEEYELTQKQELYLKRLCRRKFRIKSIVKVSFFKQRNTFERILKYFS